MRNKPNHRTTINAATKRINLFTAIFPAYQSYRLVHVPESRSAIGSVKIKLSQVGTSRCSSVSLCKSAWQKKKLTQWDSAIVYYRSRLKQKKHFSTDVCQVSMIVRQCPFIPTCDERHYGRKVSYPKRKTTVILSPLWRAHTWTYPSEIQWAIGNLPPPPSPSPCRKHLNWRLSLKAKSQDRCSL